jgi:hypothetical protein
VAAPRLRRSARPAGALAVLAAAVLAAPAAAQAPAWQPDLAAAIRYASHRHGTIAFAVRTESGSWGWHANRTFPSASVLEAMLLVAYLDLPSVRARVLGPGDRALLAPMIRRSDTAAAGRVLGIVGAGRLSALARRAGMRRFIPVTGIWGSSTGWVDHQVALLTHGDDRVSVAILTYLDGSHPYGKETLRGIALRLLKSL